MNAPKDAFKATKTQVNYYDVLGVKPNASKKQIGEAFEIKKKMVRDEFLNEEQRRHAHIDGAPFLEVLEQLEDARNTLANSKIRKAYDKALQQESKEAKQAAKLAEKSAKDTKPKATNKNNPTFPTEAETALKAAEKTTKVAEKETNVQAPTFDDEDLGLTTNPLLRAANSARLQEAYKDMIAAEKDAGKRSEFESELQSLAENSAYVQALEQAQAKMPKAPKAVELKEERMVLRAEPEVKNQIRTKETLYSLLGVSESATTKEIQTAARKIMLKNHPDKMNGKTEEEKEKASKIFAEVGDAIKILGDDASEMPEDLTPVPGDLVIEAKLKIKKSEEEIVKNEKDLAKFDELSRIQGIKSNNASITAFNSENHVKEQALVVEKLKERVTKAELSNKKIDEKISQSITKAQKRLKTIKSNLKNNEDLISVSGEKSLLSKQAIKENEELNLEVERLTTKIDLLKQSSNDNKDNLDKIKNELKKEEKLLSNELKTHDKNLKLEKKEKANFKSTDKKCIESDNKLQASKRNLQQTMREQNFFIQDITLKQSSALSELTKAEDQYDKSHENLKEKTREAKLLIEQLIEKTSINIFANIDDLDKALSQLTISTDKNKAPLSETKKILAELKSAQGQFTKNTANLKTVVAATQKEFVKGGKSEVRDELKEHLNKNSANLQNNMVLAQGSVVTSKMLDAKAKEADKIAKTWASDLKEKESKELVRPFEKKLKKAEEEAVQAKNAMKDGPKKLADMQADLEKATKYKEGRESAIKLSENVIAKLNKNDADKRGMAPAGSSAIKAEEDRIKALETAKASLKKHKFELVNAKQDEKTKINDLAKFEKEVKNLEAASKKADANLEKAINELSSARSSINSVQDKSTLNLLASKGEAVNAARKLEEKLSQAKYMISAILDKSKNTKGKLSADEFENKLMALKENSEIGATALAELKQAQVTMKKAEEKLEKSIKASEKDLAKKDKGHISDILRKDMSEARADLAKYKNSQFGQKFELGVKSLEITLKDAKPLIKDLEKNFANQDNKNLALNNLAKASQEYKNNLGILAKAKTQVRQRFIDLAAAGGKDSPELINNELVGTKVKKLEALILKSKQDLKNLEQAQDKAKKSEDKLKNSTKIAEKDVKNFGNNEDKEALKEIIRSNSKLVQISKKYKNSIKIDADKLNGMIGVVVNSNSQLQEIHSKENSKQEKITKKETESEAKLKVIIEVQDKFKASTEVLESKKEEVSKLVKKLTSKEYVNNPSIIDLNPLLDQSKLLKEALDKMQKELKTDEKALLKAHEKAKKYIKDPAYSKVKSDLANFTKENVKLFNKGINAQEDIKKLNKNLDNAIKLTEGGVKNLPIVKSAPSPQVEAVRAPDPLLQANVKKKTSVDLKRMNEVRLDIGEDIGLEKAAKNIINSYIDNKDGKFNNNSVVRIVETYSETASLDLQKRYFPDVNPDEAKEIQSEIKDNLTKSLTENFTKVFEDVDARRKELGKNSENKGTILGYIKEAINKVLEKIGLRKSEFENKRENIVESLSNVTARAFLKASAEEVTKLESKIAKEAALEQGMDSMIVPEALPAPAQLKKSDASILAKDDLKGFEKPEIYVDPEDNLPTIKSKDDIEVKYSKPSVNPTPKTEVQPNFWNRLTSMFFSNKTDKSEVKSSANVTFKPEAKPKAKDDLDLKSVNPEELAEIAASLKNSGTKMDSSKESKVALTTKDPSKEQGPTV